MKRLIFAGLLIMIGYPMAAQQSKKIEKLPTHMGELWTDTDGNPINAHGAGILVYEGTYYMFGEIKKGVTWQVPGQSWEDFRVPAGGVSCYSSKDLVKWKSEGIALQPVTGDPKNDLDTGRVIERPKVVYNIKTKKFVMWMHIDKNDYSYSQSGVATSDQPAGPYKYLGSVKPNGQMARDMTVFKDEDEKAYLIYSSESNKTMHVCLLSDDYLAPTTTYSRITSAINREAPAVFKYNKKYYLITSDCSGWSPNPATYAVADNLLGEWKQKGDPCKGAGAENTFQSQSTFVLPMPGHKDVFIFMADRWNKSNLEDSRYVWLPLKMINGQPEISVSSKY
ncbi:MAG: glycoside hydrolase family 43 protein [Ferruginibacter sp.]